MSRPGLDLRVAGGRVAKLSLKVPWTSLGAQPLVVTLYSVHCTLRGGAKASSAPPSPTSAQRGHTARGSGAGAAGRTAHGVNDAHEGAQQEAHAAPSYVQGLLQNMLASVIIKVSSTTLNVTARGCQGHSKMTPPERNRQRGGERAVPAISADRHAYGKGGIPPPPFSS